MTEIIINTLQTNIPEITHKVGNIYVDTNKGTLYILSQVGVLQVALISIAPYSNRENEAYRVQEIGNISDEVFQKYLCTKMKLHLCSSVSIDYTV